MRTSREYGSEAGHDITGLTSSGRRLAEALPTAARSLLLVVLLREAGRACQDVTGLTLP